ncbi:hypothetical protein ALI144C_50780 [Actinosynnema sp. ALI-1.44]|uniref:macrolide family glycosyltransferase n=1 Tax=Actinosynnema sp. ALI-1.44 TaxID=1933779 RepID=UPI00097CB58E|nr:macrolide family glycosyltransferase [Actinosynnema sp. ALI-1.44]ONI70879.1 hypothetical protein ALI144C_50780 [Actinosynnema sp. ALI-1.44]
MRMLFVVLTGQGHIAPTLPLVAELVRRGNQVDYACEKPVGAEENWVELPLMSPYVPEDDDVMAGWFKHFLKAMSATYPVLLDHCTRSRPDVIVYDSTNWPARLVAGKLGIPAVRTIPNFAANEAFPLHRTMTAMLTPDARGALEAECAAFSRQHGVPLDFDGTLDAAERLNLVFLPREFQPEGDSFGEDFRFIGPMLGDRARHEQWTPPVPSRPLLYISLGSVLNDVDFYTTCLNEFGDTEWQVAMTIGETNPADLGPVPSNIEIRPRFPQVAVLRQADVFISHTGMNSTMEALAYGVPIVAFPLTPEQAANADRVVQLELGERVLPGDSLKAAVDRVRTKDLGWIRDVIGNSGGAARGADEIENYLVGTRGTQRAL